jgi:hypothetical protein
MLRGIWGIVSAAALMGMSGAALAHNGAITLDGNVSGPITITTTTSRSRANPSDAKVSASQQLEGVVEAPLALTSGAAGTSGMVAAASGSLELMGQQTYAVQSGAAVMFHGMPYDGGMLYPGERVHAAVQSGMVSVIDLESAAAWETYESSASGTVTLEFDGGTAFTAPLASNAVIREPGGPVSAASTSLKVGTLVRVVWNAQGQIVMMGARGMGDNASHQSQHAAGSGQNKQRDTSHSTEGGNSGPIANPLGNKPGDVGQGHGHSQSHGRD